MHLLHPPPRYPEPLPAVGEALYYPIGAYSPFTGLVTSPYRHGSRRPLPPLLEDDRAAEALFSLHPVPGGAGVRDAQGVNLVLGILPSGDYALLLPSHSVHIPGSLPTPHTASEFLSLSPAHYPTKEKLLAALKRTKERKAAHLGPGRRGNAGRLAAFEHARIFYKMYGPASYTLLGAPANRAAPHILVIQFNLWCPLTSAQDAAPVLLDAAWARADLRTGTLEEEQYVVCHGALRQPGQEWAVRRSLRLLRFEC
ncbi:hypothetical protein CALVIDRAFT_347888 [Calocera viscosa TUFC12733]|uniref:Uncharacterized protein n=1 Tax=Calocera viscosa (strain TUFC12733) TaxID=1330018 RepID=A0A167H8I4_CALVF|nr:hypothetical protein CALVIDRAFT_347888 [Calocera viscosa TUFC12733]